MIGIYIGPDGRGFITDEAIRTGEIVVLMIIGGRRYRAVGLDAASRAILIRASADPDSNGDEP